MKTKLCSDKNRKAFTMIESIISLIVAAMIISLVGLVINIFIKQRLYDNHLTAFHMYLRTIEASNYRFEELKNHNRNLILSANNKRYIISLTNHSIRMTTENGGYVPLIDGVAELNWQYHNRILTTKLIMNNGDTFKARSLMRLEAR